MRAKLTTAAEILGATLITAGAWLVWLPLGLLVAGVFFMLFGWLAASE